MNVDTGKMAWYFQTSPHDTHDWDSTQTPVLVDMPFNGRMRKLVMTATRNGYFFVLDRTTGEHLVTQQARPGEQLGERSRREGPAEAQSEQGRDDRRIARQRRRDELSAADVLAADRAVLRARAELVRISYLMDPDPRGSMGLGGTGGGAKCSWGTNIVAIDYKTGKIAWRKEGGGAPGLLSTAGGLLFRSGAGGVEALEATTGKAGGTRR